MYMYNKPQRIFVDFTGKQELRPFYILIPYGNGFCTGSAQMLLHMHENEADEKYKKKLFAAYIFRKCTCTINCNGFYVDFTGKQELRPFYML